MNLQNELRAEYGRLVTRRWFFRQCGVGLGSIALASLLKPEHAMGGPAPALPNPLAPKQPHFQPKANRVIYLFMGGAPSQLELFYTKPVLAKYNAKPGPAQV